MTMVELIRFWRDLVDFLKLECQQGATVFAALLGYANIFQLVLILSEFP